MLNIEKGILSHDPHAAELSEHDLAFLNQLKAEAETPLREPALDGAHTRWEGFLKRYMADRSALTKADLYAVDRLVLEMASPEELRAEASGLYQRYCDERGEAADPADIAMKPATPGRPETPEETEALRARLLQILRSLHWSYTFGPLREKRRVQLIRNSMWLMLAATVILAGVLVYLHYVHNGQHAFFAVLATVVYAGVMGGAVSCTRRLGAVPTRGDALGSIYALKNSGYVLYFAPLTGAVFAVITMLLFVGGVIKGVIFPTFNWVQPAAGGPWAFTNALLPKESSDYALLFLWCFIAGFAERFIPDTLTHLTERASETGKAAPPARAATPGITGAGSEAPKEPPKKPESLVIASR
jgi:hypothetical protein